MEIEREMIFSRRVSQLLRPLSLRCGLAWPTKSRVLGKRRWQELQVQSARDVRRNGSRLKSSTALAFPFAIRIQPARRPSRLRHDAHSGRDRHRLFPRRFFRYGELHYAPALPSLAEFPFALSRPPARPRYLPFRARECVCVRVDKYALMLFP